MFSNLEPIEAIGLSMPPASVGRAQPTCQLTPGEDVRLKKTGNFVSEAGQKQQAKKIARLKNFTSLQNFESDVRGMTPISPMNTSLSSMDTSPNPGFTPINSFASNVMNITSIDNLGNL